MDSIKLKSIQYYLTQKLYNSNIVYLSNCQTFIVIFHDFMTVSIVYRQTECSVVSMLL